MSTDIDEDPPTQRPAPQISDDEFWLVSYAEDDDRELTTKEIVAAMKRGEITLSTLVWRDGMGEWQSIASIDELRARAGFIVQPFLTDAPPRPAAAGLKAIAALSEDIEELPSSAIQSAPPSSLAEADFLGIEDGEASLAPPRIDHAAFFTSSPPPGDPDNKGAALPPLPGRGAGGAVANASAAPASKPAQKSQGGGLKWVLVVLTVLGAATAGFLLTPAKEDAPPPQPAVSRPELPAPVAVAANPTDRPAGDNPGTNNQAGEGATQDPAAGSPGVAAVAQPTPAAVAAAPVAQPPPAMAQANPAPAKTNPTTGTATPAEAKPAPVTSPPPQPRVTSTDPFNKGAASAALSQAATHASSCRQPGDPSGTAQVEVTFSPSGRATRAIIGGPPFRGTATGSCIAQAMRAAQVPPFAGDLVTVQKRVVIQ